MKENTMINAPFFNRINMVRWLLALTLLFAAYGEAAQRVSEATKVKLQRELPILGLAVGNPVLLRTFKKESRLEMWIKPKNKKKYVLFRTYPICDYSGDLGPKQRTGDKMTPEGFYYIEEEGLNPLSRFHLSLNIGYPNAYDRYHGRSGSLLMIHGACDSIGCFAMGNDQVEEIYYLVEQALANGENSVPVHAFPFHLTDKNLAKYKNNRWYDFWQSLKRGYDTFNRDEVPPIIGLEESEYTVRSGN